MIKQPRYYRKVIQITADDSPNVRYAKAQIARGEEPTDEMIIPGVLSWSEYQKRLRVLDPKEKSVSLFAEFYEGKEVLLFPREVLNTSADNAARLGPRRKGRCMGVDTAEGGDNSCWSIIDDVCLVFQKSIKTADTADIPGETIGLMREFGVHPQDVAFDRGGGGKQHADALRRRGFDVRSMGFGEAAGNAVKAYQTATVIPKVKRVDLEETRYVYKNRRAEMYGLLAIAVEAGFGLPSEHTETHRQLSLIPKLYDTEGRLYLPPKDKPSENYKGTTLKQILGCSPDEADSLVLANYARVKPIHSAMAGAVR